MNNSKDHQYSMVNLSDTKNMGSVKILTIVTIRRYLCRFFYTNSLGVVYYINYIHDFCVFYDRFVGETNDINYQNCHIF